MKLLDRISEALGLYEEDDEIIEETPSEQPEEKPAKKSLFSRKSAANRNLSANRFSKAKQLLCPLQKPFPYQWRKSRLK